MNIVGISSHFHDSAACLLQDGQLVAAAQEERFTRVKHDASIPRHAFLYCLREAGLRPADIDYVAYYENPFRKLERQLWMGLPDIPITFPHRVHQLDPHRPEREIRGTLGLECPLVYTDHHRSHAASAFFYSGFPEAAVLTVDGVGEWDTLTYGYGRGATLELTGCLEFPHSIGLLYSTITAYLGFEVNDGEYKVMGLAPYGKPVHTDTLFRLIRRHEKDAFELDLRYFAFLKTNRMYSPELEALLGRPARAKESWLEAFHMDIARSLQDVLETLLLEKTRYLHGLGYSENLCMAGGVALNCVANARILREGPFRRLFVQPGASDAGSCLGAAALAHAEKTGTPPAVRRMKNLYLGPAYSHREIRGLFAESDVGFRDFHGREDDLLRYVAEKLAANRVIGWFDHRMEFGPRALGARSILADPRVADMRDRINAAVKKREGFRPFAPSVLEERCAEFFEIDHVSPFMLETCQARYTEGFPAITHCDGSARVQTVNEEDNGRYYRLIRAFDRLTGCPMLLNTSFNLRGEPIVNTPMEAFLCFVRSAIDVLVLGDIVIERSDLSPKILEWYGDTLPLLREGVSNAVYTFL
jgi:carbamoyltransferase